MSAVEPQLPHLTLRLGLQPVALCDEALGGDMLARTARLGLSFFVQLARAVGHPGYPGHGADDLAALKHAGFVVTSLGGHFRGEALLRQLFPEAR